MNIAIIPARGGSKRIKNKNIKKFNKKPIIELTFKVLKKSNLIKRGGDGTPLPDSSAPGDFISDSGGIVFI